MSWTTRKPEVTWQTCPRKTADAPRCDDCGELPRGQRCCITEQTSIMRGGDKVTFLCIPCAIIRGVKPGGSVALIMFDAMTDDEKTLIAGRLMPAQPPQGDQS